MDLAARKYNFIQRLSEVDEQLMDKLKRLLNRRKSVDSNRISLQQYSEEITQANSRIEKGHFLTSEEAESLAKEW